MTGSHKRNTGAMRASPRCGARTRKGTPCQAPAVTGKRRCRMHGGAPGSGAPPGNRNAVKHGFYAAENRLFLEHVRQTLRRGRDQLK